MKTDIKTDDIWHSTAGVAREERGPLHGMTPVSTASSVSPVPPAGRFTTSALRTTAIYASIVLWLATIAGNVVLFSVRPPSHWPLLESLETLQVISLIPIALILHAINRRSRLSLAITTVGLAAMLGAIVIDVAFVTGAVTYSRGFIGGPGFYICEASVLVWLLAANLLALRTRTLPRRLATFGIATALTATLPYVVWATWLARTLTREHRA